MVSIPALIVQEGARWKGCAVLPASQNAFNQVALRLVAEKAKKVYQEIEAETRVPWYVIAVIHERESSQRWDRSIAQGDRWDAVSRNVPRGRGPFKSFKEAAYDALVNCAPKAARWTDWSIGGILTILEEYNGLGYASGPSAKVNGVRVQYPPMPSPYIWGGTNIQTRGKYTGDGVFSISTMDTQLGCAGLLMAMQKLDKSIVFGTAPHQDDAVVARVSPSKPAVPVVASPSIVPQPTAVRPAGPPSVTNPAAGSIGDAVGKLFHALFGHV